MQHWLSFKYNVINTCSARFKFLIIIIITWLHIFLNHSLSNAIKSSLFKLQNKGVSQEDTEIAVSIHH